MKKLIIVLSMLLMSATAAANHLTGLKSHQSGQHTYGTHVAGGSVGVVTPKGALFINQASSRQPNIVTDPVSCIEKWGDACLDFDLSINGGETPALDLGGINVADEIVPFEDGESIESILDTEPDADFVGPLPE